MPRSAAGAVAVAFFRKQLERLEQRRVGVREPAGRRLCAGQRRQELDALGLPARFAEQPQRGGEPAGGRRRRALRGAAPASARTATAASSPAVAETLDVMGARRRRGSAGGQGLRAALVRAEPPAGRGRLVDGAPHERMAEAKAARHVGRPDEIVREQLVDRRDRRRLR